MPDVTGLSLSGAQARLAAQGYPTVEAIDSTGHGRAVLDPANWIVQSQSPAAGTRGAAGAMVTLRVRKPSDAAGAPSNSRGVVPDVVCRDLQTAQDALQAAGFGNLTSRDATAVVPHVWLSQHPRIDYPLWISGALTVAVPRRVSGEIALRGW